MAKRNSNKATGNNNSATTTGGAPATTKPYSLSARAIRVLQLLAKHGQLTRKQLVQHTGQRKGYSKLLGSHTVANGGQSGTNNLAGQGYVQYVRGAGGFAYTITKQGTQALAKAVKPAKPAAAK